MPATSEEVIELFPLGTVLLPHGRVPLQIFESRYLDLVSNCLKHSQGFGIVLINEGDEVIRNKGQAAPTVKQHGCYGEIVHWDGLPNNRLAIIVEGKRVFEIQESWVNPHSKRMQARVAFLEAEHSVPLADRSAAPSEQASVHSGPGLEHIHDIFNRLLAHPMIEALQYPRDWQDFSAISFALGQLLPINNHERYRLLSLDFEHRVIALEEMLERLGGA